MTDSTTTVSAAVDVVNTTFDRLEAALSKLASFLGVPAKQVYEIFVRQESISAWAWIITLGGMMFLASIILFTFAAKLYEPEERQSDAFTGCVVCGIIALVICIIVIGVNTVTIINPEYYAIQTLSETVKTITAGQGR